MLRPYTQKLTLEDAAHLLRRVAFGGTPAQIRALEGKRAQDALEPLLTWTLEERKDNPFDPADAIKNNAAIKFAQMRWLFEMVHSPFPARERLTFFWHSHFDIGVDKVRAPQALAEYLGILRGYATAEFEGLALAVSKSPAMLRYLDNDLNKKGKPNENFARELFELFTLGIGHYSERDVQEAARAYTGWTFKGAEKRKDQVFGPFEFRAKDHDAGAKTVLGQTGNFTGEDLIRIAASHPATPRFVGGKIWRAFVSPSPSSADLEDLAKVWEDSGGDLGQIFRALFSSEVFYASKRALIASPLEHVVGSMRALNLPVQDEKVYGAMLSNLNTLGQVPLAPPNVSGWEGGRSWISDGALLARMNVAAALSLGKKIEHRLPDLSLALLGSEKTAHRPLLEGLTPQQQAYLMMISPEYALG